MLWSTHLEPDILEGEVKWASGSITMNTASGGDGIPIKLFQIVKDDAVKVLHLICQWSRKTQQWLQDWKRSIFIPIPNKDNVKECSNYCTIVLISHGIKIMLKILQGSLQQYVNWELPDVQSGFRKTRGTRDQIANISWIIQRTRELKIELKKSTSSSLSSKAFDGGSQLWKSFSRVWLCESMDCKVHGILQARILEWVAFPFSRGSPQPRDRTQVSHTAGRFFTSWANCGKFLEMRIPEHLTCLLKNLCMGQTATLWTLHGTTDFQNWERSSKLARLYMVTLLI